MKKLTTTILLGAALAALGTVSAWAETKVQLLEVITSPAILRPSTSRSFLPRKRASMPTSSRPATMPVENRSSSSLGRSAAGARVTTATPS